MPLDASGLPRVIPYRGEVAGDEADVHRILADLRAAGLPRPAGLAGDLMIDGSFGSRTAALHQDYTDAAGHRGHLYLDAGQVRDHVIACTRTGLQAGFHVIGDAAVDALLTGVSAAAEVVGLTALRAARHRIEHLEAIDPAGIATAARLGLIASVQPGFDAAWGGTDRMYAIRLGPDRATGLNPFAAMHAAGITLAFGSDSPVTPFAPWEGIRAALLHRTQAHRIPFTAAFAAHTTGAHLAGRGPHPEPTPMMDDDKRHPGTLRVGDRADLAAWRSPGLTAAPTADPFAVLTDELTAGDPVPTCVLTLIAGRPAHSGLS